MMDATGASKFSDFVRKCGKHGTAVIISGLQPQPESVLRQMRVIGDGSPIHLAPDFAEATRIAPADHRELIRRHRLKLEPSRPLGDRKLPSLR